MALVNQRQLALLQRVSRATIIAWTREGLPVAQRGGPGRPTLYDEAAAQRWCLAQGKGATWQAIAHKARRAELLRPDPRSPDVCTGIAEVDLARSLALARVEVLQELQPADGGESDLPGLAPATCARVVSIYLDHLVIALRAAGYAEVDEILAELQSPAAWEGTLEECIARARAEVPQ